MKWNFIWHNFFQIDFYLILMDMEKFYFGNWFPGQSVQFAERNN
jgi:hypothetical protein